MDERFQELARLVGEQLAQRWAARAPQREPPRAEPRRDVGAEGEHDQPHPRHGLDNETTDQTRSG